MSMELYVAVGSASLPTGDELTQMLQQDGFAASISPIDWQTQSGFFPIVLAGHQTGVEITVFPETTAKEFLGQSGRDLSSVKRIVAFRWGSKMPEVICAYALAAMIARHTGGWIYEPHGAGVLSPETALAEAREAMESSAEQPNADHAQITQCSGDLLDQDVDVIVNTWNRNIIPWWLLIPQGVSGAIKRRAGRAPFQELAKHGPIPLGGAVITGAGRLAFKGIIHVAAINLLWRSTEAAIRACTANALRLATQHGFRSIAFPIIGAGSGGFDMIQAQRIMLEEIAVIPCELEVVVVEYP